MDSNSFYILFIFAILIVIISVALISLVKNNKNNKEKIITNQNNINYKYKNNEELKDSSANIIYKTEQPEYINLGNLIFEKKYEEAILEGKKLLEENNTSAGAHINMMDAYFKARENNNTYFNLSTYHAKQAMIYGHNTGYAQDRLRINLEKEGKYNQVIQLCNIILLDSFSFSQLKKELKEKYLNHKNRIQNKINKATDESSDILFTEEEKALIFKNLNSISRGIGEREMKRYKKLDFVVGYEIKNRNNDCCSLCSKLNGKYPKEFIWNGWHAGCGCDIYPILKSDDEFYNRIEDSKNKIKELPKNYILWFERNKKFFNEENTPEYVSKNLNLINDSIKYFNNSSYDN